MEQDAAFIEYVVKQLVEKPDAVKIERTVDEMGVLIQLTVDQSDMGRVIGKEGRTAKALRTLLRVMGAKNNARVNLKIMEPGGGEVKIDEGNEKGEKELPANNQKDSAKTTKEETPIKEVPAAEEAPTEEKKDEEEKATEIL